MNLEGIFAAYCMRGPWASERQTSANVLKALQSGPGGFVAGGLFKTTCVHLTNNYHEVIAIPVPLRQRCNEGNFLTTIQ